MSRIRVVTDSACDLPDQLAQSLDVSVVSLSIRFADDEYLDRLELSPEEFWEKCANASELPETSAPSVGAFQKVFDESSRDGYDGVIVLTISSKLSATFQAATVAAQAVASSIDVRVIDTLAVSMAQGLLVIDVAHAAHDGATLDELCARAADLIHRVGVVATLDTLDHLIKGGRIGGAKALLGQVLSIKPLVELRDGLVAEAGRQRTRSRAIAAVAQSAQSRSPLSRVALMHGACSDSDVAALRQLATAITTTHPLIETFIGPVVGTHGGPGIIGLAWIRA